MLPIVAIDMAEPSHEYAAAMIEACTAALRHGRCRLAPVEDGRVSAVALVSWISTDRMGAEVEVGEGANGGGRWLTQSIRFAPEDPEVERWRVVGIAVATLAGDLEEAAETTDAPPPHDRIPKEAAQDEQSDRPGSGSDEAGSGEVRSGAHALDANEEPRERPDQTSSFAPGWVSVGGASSVDQEAWRGGVWVRGAWAPIRPVFVTVAGTLAVQPRVDRAKFVWEGVSLGGGAQWSARQLHLDMRTEALLERVTASRRGSEPRVSVSKVLGGIRIGVGVVWPDSRPVAATAGFEMDRRFRAVRVLLDDEQDIAELPASSFTALAGLRWAPSLKSR